MVAIPSTIGKSEALSKFRNSPIGFATRVLGVTPELHQGEILNSVRDRRRTLVVSCNSIGKDFIASVATHHFLQVHEKAQVITTAPTGELSPVGYGDLAGWRDDDHGAALIALVRSCARFAKLPDDRAVGPDGLAGTIADWRDLCAAATGARSAPRAFFEAWFVPFKATDRGRDEGLFTGYYEPLLHGALAASARYATPLYGRPDDLVTVELGAFDDELKGKRIAGRVVGGKLRLYESRAEITAGALDGRARPIAWVDDPVDAFFLHVQGSGRVQLDDGGMLRVGYAAANGRDYVSIGRVLIERGALSREEVSLQTIRAWLAAHPDEARQLLDQNPSFVFFRKLEGDGPIGAQGVALTAMRSLAIDRKFLPLGAPVWLDITVPDADPAAPDRPLRRLLVAQDTGGAIKGPLRGDVFWGFGADAESIAGRMKHRGRLYLLLPRAVAATRLAAAD